MALKDHLNDIAEYYEKWRNPNLEYEWDSYQEKRAYEAAQEKRGQTRWNILKGGFLATLLAGVCLVALEIHGCASQILAEKKAQWAEVSAEVKALTEYEKERMVNDFHKRLLDHEGRLDEGARAAYNAVPLAEGKRWSAERLVIQNLANGYINRCQDEELHERWVTDYITVKTGEDSSIDVPVQRKETYVRNIYNATAAEIIRIEIREKVKAYDEKMQNMTPEHDEWEFGMAKPVRFNKRGYDPKIVSRYQAMQQNRGYQG